jgi:hypothetical protein
MPIEEVRKGKKALHGKSSSTIFYKNIFIPSQPGLLWDPARGKKFMYLASNFGNRKKVESYKHQFSFTKATKNR